MKKIMAHSLTITTENPEGFVHIDDKRFPLSVGGVRLIEGVNLEETQLLAKAMSYKLHTYGLPISGAKAGVSSDDLDDFYQFIGKDKIKQLIRGDENHQFVTGPDIGTSEEEYYTALKKAGLEDFIRKGLLSQESERYGLPMDNIVTAYGVCVVAEELLRRDKRSDPLNGKTFALEGFGKVGTGIAKIIENRGKLIAVSTRYGCIRAENDGEYVSNGQFEISELIELQQQYGDKFIFETDQEVLSPGLLFSTSCDVLVPGARTEVVTYEVAEQILKARPRAVVPVSNYPYTDEGLKLLEDAAITAFPDFVASAGAVIAAMIEFADAGGQEEAMNLVHQAIATETRQLLMAAKACTDYSKTMYEIAVDRAMENKKRLLSDISGSQLDTKHVAKSLIETYLPGLLKD